MHNGKIGERIRCYACGANHLRAGPREEEGGGGRAAEAAGEGVHACGVREMWLISHPLFPTVAWA